MTHLSHPIRPARAAIAAVLALTATPLMAQDLAPGPEPVLVPTLPQAMPVEPSGPATAPSGAGGTAISTPAPTIQAQPPAASLPGTTLASPVAPPAASDIPETSGSVTGPTDTPLMSRAAPAQPSEAAPVATAPAPATNTAQGARSSAVVDDVGSRTVSGAASGGPIPGDTIVPRTPEELNVLPPMPNGGTVSEAPVSEVTAPPPAPAEGNGEVWGWMAALLAALGIGGGAIALRRTRTRKSAAMMAESHASDAAYDRRLASPHARPPVAPTLAAAAPSTASFAQPAIQSAPARTVARQVNPDSPVDHRRLEALIAQRPNRDNPFKTRANRKRRALFLMRNGYGLQSAA